MVKEKIPPIPKTRATPRIINNLTPIYFFMAIGLGVSTFGCIHCNT